MFRKSANQLKKQVLMNYADNQKLKTDMTELNDKLYEVWKETKRIEQEYRWGSENLADRFAGKIVGEVHDELAKLVEKINEITYLFSE